MKSVWCFPADMWSRTSRHHTYFNKSVLIRVQATKSDQWYFHWNATSNSYLHFTQLHDCCCCCNSNTHLNDALARNIIVKAITEKPSNILLEHRYHKRCIYCNSKWIFSLAWSGYYLSTATCQEVFMSHGFVSRFYYRVRLFNAQYIMLWVLSLFKSFISWLFLILCIISLLQFSIRFFSSSDLCRSSERAATYMQHTLHCHCVYMHQHQQWFTVKVFGVWNDDDGNRIICGREVKFMFGNAFLQSHCLWMYIRWQCAHIHIQFFFS